MADADGVLFLSVLFAVFAACALVAITAYRRIRS